MNYKAPLFYSLIFSLLFVSCKRGRNTSLTEKKQQVLIENNELVNWHTKDVYTDSIVGISLEKAYKTLLKDKKGEEVIVAVIDTEIDKSHQDLKDYMWINSDEVVGNNLDDDKNGYVDDYYGWNFIGNQNKQNILYTNYDYVRYVKKYDSIFSAKNLEDIEPSLKPIFIEYKRAKSAYDVELKTVIENSTQYNFMYKSFKNAEKNIQAFLKTTEVSLKALDSLQKTNPELENDIFLISNSIKYDIREEDMLDQLEFLKNSKEKYLNLDLEDRKILGDDPDDLSDIAYGSPYISENTDVLYHGTLVAGIIANGLKKDFKIMPLPISTNGDEYDKDIALAIRYAVDNGANVINMSFGKAFSLHRDWVMEALQYANDQNVLVVTSAGNDGRNIDLVNNINFPEDQGYQSTIQNFIKVGSISYDFDKNFASLSTNYGKKNVDVFAPGVDIYTTSSQQKEGYEFVTGTSFAAPVVSVVGGLLYSYYPELSVGEIKKIILDSGQCI